MKKKEQVWARDPEEEVEENWELEADPNKREWDLRYGFYKSTPGRYGLVCWTCKYAGHRARTIQPIGEEMPGLWDPIVRPVANTGTRLCGVRQQGTVN